MLTPSKAIPKFDPEAPVPNRTLANIMATGVGQAASNKLNACAIGGSAAAAAICIASPRLWWLATPFVCLACFGIWGLATKRRYVIALRRERAPALRVTLDLIRGAALLLAGASATAGLVRAVIFLMAPDWVL